MTPEPYALRSAEAFGELAQTAQRYFDMIYNGDMSLFDTVFHSDARLFTIENGEPVFRSLDDYRTILSQRTSPAALGAPREDELIAIDVASPTQALIKLKLRIDQAAFLDYLTLLRVNDGWRIVSKTYHKMDVMQ
jgi:hypothetical protein